MIKLLNIKEIKKNYWIKQKKHYENKKEGLREQAKNNYRELPNE